MNKRAKWLRWGLRGLGIGLLVLVLGALILPYLFRDKLVAYAKAYVNEQLEAEVDFSRVSLSLLWTFPQFSFVLEDFSMVGRGIFEGYPLAEVKRLDLRLNLWSVIRGDYRIKGLVLEEPRLRVKVLRDGRANYEVMKVDTTGGAVAEPSEAGGESSFRLALDYYAIRGGLVLYEDYGGGISLRLEGLEHSGQGDFTAMRYDLYTKTEVKALSLAYGGINYLSNKVLQAEMGFGIDMETGVYRFLKNRFQLNDCILNWEGEVKQLGTAWDLDLRVSSPQTSFASVLSLIPGVYRKDFASVQTRGSFNFAAFVKGLYDERGVPSFGLDLSIREGFFKYPDLPLAVEGVLMDLSIKSPTRNLDEMQVDLRDFAFRLGQNPFGARFSLRRPLSDPALEGKAKGRLVLEDLAKAVPLEGVELLRGLMDLDLATKMRLSQVERGDYEGIELLGRLVLSGFGYQGGGLLYEVEALRMNFSPNHVDVEEGRFKFGKSDLEAKGRLDNLLAYFSKTKILTGDLSFKSKRLDLNELMGEETAETSSEPRLVDSTEAQSDGVFDRFRFVTQIDFKDLRYGDYVLKNLVASGHASSSVFSLERASWQLDKSNFEAKAKFHEIFGYLFGEQTLKGELDLRCDYLDLNTLMPVAEPSPTTTSQETTASSTTGNFVLPAQLDLRITGAIQKLDYLPYQLEQVETELLLKHQKMEIVRLSALGLGGRLNFFGSYACAKADKADFSFGYDLSRLDIQNIRQTVTWLEAYLPILPYLKGRFDTQFKLEGRFDAKGAMQLDQVQAKGLTLTYDALLERLPLLEQAGRALGLEKNLNNISLNNTKNFFEIKDGNFNLQDFEFKSQGIEAILGGQHNLNGQGKYQLKLRIPQSLMQKQATGQALQQAGQQGWAALQSQAQRLNINLQRPDISFYNLAVEITGSLSQPKFQVRLLQVETSQGQSLGNQVETDLRAEADRLKQEAEAKARAEAEKLKQEADRLKQEAETKARAEAERLKQEAETRARAEAQRLNQEAEKAKQEAEARARAEAQRLKEEAEKAARNKLPQNLPNPLRRN